MLQGGQPLCVRHKVPNRRSPRKLAGVPVGSSPATLRAFDQCQKTNCGAGARGVRGKASSRVAPHVKVVHSPSIVYLLLADNCSASLRPHRCLFPPSACPLGPTPPCPPTDLSRDEGKRARPCPAPA